MARRFSCSLVAWVAALAFGSACGGTGEEPLDDGGTDDAGDVDGTVPDADTEADGEADGEADREEGASDDVATETDAPPSCGDGVLDSGTGEQCDDGPDNSDTEPDACRTDCTLAHCGDAVVDTGETCDDGPANSDAAADACRTSC
jgi:hypothetical protein